MIHRFVNCTETLFSGDRSCHGRGLRAMVVQLCSCTTMYGSKFMACRHVTRPKNKIHSFILARPAEIMLGIILE